MGKRKIISIDELKCNGCGECIPNCPEGAIQVIDNKARLISDLFCDGLGACLGHCPQGAISIEERNAEEYDEKKVMVNIVKQGKNVIKAHLTHLKEHKQEKFLLQALDYLKKHKVEFDPGVSQQACAHNKPGGFSACPGSRIVDATKEENINGTNVSLKMRSQLRQWPIQLMLVPAVAPFLNNADLLIAADCVAFSYADFHNSLLKGKVLLVGCPKLDDTSVYQEKISQIIENNNLKSVTYAHMEVPCCFGLVNIIKEAISSSGKKIPFSEVVISIKGEKMN